MNTKDTGIYKRIESLAFRASRKYKLGLEWFIPMDNPSRYYGLFHSDTNAIEMTVRFKKHGKWLPRHSKRAVIDTLAHELAHFKSMEHDDTHKLWEQKIGRHLRMEVNR